MRAKTRNHNYFKILDSQLKAYLLGFIAADGCIQLNSARNAFVLSLTLHQKDRCILEKLKTELDSDNKVSNLTTPHTHDKTKNKEHCRFAVTSTQLYHDILSWGITPKKSTTMPNIVVNIPKKYRKSFILGYFDGDGSVTKNLKRNQLMVSFRGTKEFLNGIATELNLSSKWLSKDKQKNCYTLVFWRKDDLISFFKIYNKQDFYLLRKYERFSEFLKISKDQTISSS